MNKIIVGQDFSYQLSARIPYILKTLKIVKQICFPSARSIVVAVNTANENSSR